MKMGYDVNKKVYGDTIDEVMVMVDVAANPDEDYY
jgi:hypothetical protein